MSEAAKRRQIRGRGPGKSPAIRPVGVLCTAVGCWALLSVVAIVRSQTGHAAPLRTTQHNLVAAADVPRTSSVARITLYVPAGMVAPLSDDSDTTHLVEELPGVRPNRRRPVSLVPMLKTRTDETDEEFDDEDGDDLWLLSDDSGGRDKPSGWGWLADSVRDRKLGKQTDSTLRGDRRRSRDPFGGAMRLRGVDRSETLPRRRALRVDPVSGAPLEPGSAFGAGQRERF